MHWLVPVVLVLMGHIFLAVIITLIFIFME